MFHRFFDSLARSNYLSFFSLSFNFTQWSAGTEKSTILQILNFYCWLLLGLVVWPRLGDQLVCQNARGVCVSHSPGHMLGCAYTICSYGQMSISCTIPSGSLICLLLYSFCANLLHSLIMWLIVSSLSPHNLHMLFCCILSILVLVWLVLIGFLCAIWRNSISLLRFPFLSYIHVFVV